MIDDVTTHATLTSYSLTVMCHFQKNNNNNAKYLRFYCREAKSTRNSKLRRLSGRFQTLIWRPRDTVQNLESPGLSGRVDSPDNYSGVRHRVKFLVAFFFIFIFFVCCDCPRDKA